MFTTVAWYEDVDCGGAYKQIDACADQHIRIHGKHIYIGDLNHIIGVYAAGGGTVLAAYYDSPSLRRICLLDVAPFQQGLTPAGAESYQPFPTNPIALLKNEGLDFYIKATDASASHKFGVALLADAALAPVGGEIFSIWGDATITGGAGAWANGNITLRQTLPVGKYQIVGAVCGGTNHIAFRFVPVGAAHRPGGICVQTLDSKVSNYQRYGRMGVWCEFDSVTPPTLDVLVNGADAVQKLVIDLIKIG